MNNFLSEIFKNKGIEFYGFCDFLSLKNELFECSAKRRLPENSKTVITVLFPYKAKEEKPKIEEIGSKVEEKVKIEEVKTTSEINNAQWISFSARLTVGQALELKEFFDSRNIEFKAI